MRARNRAWHPFPGAVPRIALVFAFVASAIGCNGAGTVEMLLELDAFANPRIGALRSPRIELTVLDPDGAPATGFVDANGEAFEVTSPFPVGCVGSQCSIALRLRPAAYEFSMQVFSQDQCGTEGQVLDLATGGSITVVPGTVNSIEFTRISVAFDDDGDGIENAFELQTCGRFDRGDDDRPWTSCEDDADPCCVDDVDERIGMQVEFDGLSYLGPFGDEVFVDTLYIDATEVTYGTLRRCVSARACLANAPEHPVWAAVEDVRVENDLPVVGLTPAEAQTLCEWLGRRLPTLQERDRVVAGVDDGGRHRFPWGNIRAVGCQPNDPGDVFHANHRALGQSCPGDTTPVGAYPTGDVTGANTIGGDAPPTVADLAGNVSEWTLDVDPTNTDILIPEVPEGTVRLTSSGGGYSSLPLFLENDEWFDFEVPAEDDATAINEWQATIRRFAPITGFRCISDVIQERAERSCAD